MQKVFIKSEEGVSLFECGDNIEMFIEEHLVLSINKTFKDMIYKSFDNLVKLRKSSS